MTRSPKTGKSGPNPGVSNWKFLVAAVGILVIATVLRFYHISFQELWLETLSFHIVSSPNGEEF